MVAIIGPVISSTANVAGAIVNREKVPMIAPAATAVEVTHAGEYTSRVCFLGSYQATVMAKFSREELKAEKAAVLFDVASDYSIGLKDVFCREVCGIRRGNCRGCLLLPAATVILAPS